MSEDGTAPIENKVEKEQPGPKQADSGGCTKSGGPTDVRNLSPEEQMALFEKELKEQDWGHQPC